MGIGAHHAMQIAERLYIQGYISYPRTESTGYPQGFDLKGTLRIQRRHPVWGEYVGELLDGAMERPRGGDVHLPLSCVSASTRLFPYQPSLHQCLNVRSTPMTESSRL